MLLRGARTIPRLQRHPWSLAPAARARVSSQPQPASSSSSGAEESLIPTTLAEMAANTGDSEGVELTAQLLRKQGQARLTREEKKR